jgi:AraC-like DNA-binding protein/mannose-6-phosphate isomerase-like protein (cupin superfamily)
MRENRQEPGDRRSVPLDLANDVIFVAEAHDAGEVVPAHWHDVDQLIYAASGVATVQTDDGIWVVPPARAVWVPASTVHQIEMTGEVRLTSVYVRPGTALIDRGRCCVVHVSSLLREIILRGTSIDGPYGGGGRDSRLVAVLLDEIEASGVAPLELTMPTDSRAREVALAFLVDPSQRSSRAEWASKVGASERTLERLFLRETNTTLGRWQRQARLLEALRLLAGGESVTRVAFGVGFDTPSAFIAMFRRALGATPSRYFASEAEDAPAPRPTDVATLGHQGPGTPDGDHD